MNYRKLQSALKVLKLEGLTEVKLNASQEILQTEYDRIIERLEIVENIETGNTEAVDRFIEIVEKTLVVNFSCDYKVNRSIITKNKHRTVKEVLNTIAKKTGINELDFRHVLEENVGNYFYDLVLTGYEYYRLDYCLELFSIYLSEIKTTEEAELKTPPVLEIVTANDLSFHTAIKYFTQAVNHVFKRFGSDNFTTEKSLRLSMGNDVTVNDFIKFLNLNTGFDLTEFMEYLEYHLEDQYQYFIQYSSLDYRKCPLKMILQDFAYSIDLYQLVA